jgi:hypothetical protein
MEKPIKEVEPIIKSFYQEVGGDPNLITRVWSEGDNYKVQKRGGKEVIVVREWIDDYIDSNDSTSEQKIKHILKQFCVAYRDRDAYH